MQEDANVSGSRRANRKPSTGSARSLAPVPHPSWATDQQVTRRPKLSPIEAEQLMIRLWTAIDN